MTISGCRRLKTISAKIATTATATATTAAVVARTFIFRFLIAHFILEGLYVLNINTIEVAYIIFMITSLACCV